MNLIPLEFRTSELTPGKNLKKNTCVQSSFRPQGWSVEEGSECEFNSPRVSDLRVDSRKKLEQKTCVRQVGLAPGLVYDEEAVGFPMQDLRDSRNTKR